MFQFQLFLHITEMVKLKSANHIQWQRLIYCILHKNTAKYGLSDLIYAAYQRQLDKTVHCHIQCLQFTFKKSSLLQLLGQPFPLPCSQIPANRKNSFDICLRSWSREQILRQWSKERIFLSSCSTRPELQTNIVLEDLAVGLECEQLSPALMC